MTIDADGTDRMDTTGPARTGRWRLAMGILMLVAAWFAWGSISGMDVIVDETAHLESWRNRHSGDLVSDYLVRKFEANQRLSPELKKTIIGIYLDHRAVRFLTYWMTDTPGYSTIAEITREVSGSSVQALRAVSALAAILSIPLLFRLGRCWADESVGFLLAVLFIAGPMVQLYAGIGRPYALMLFAQFLLLYRFTLLMTLPGTSTSTVFLAALFAQSIHYSAWFMALPIVAATGWTCWTRCKSWRGFLAGTWWYVVASVAMVGHATIAMAISPSVGGNTSFSLSGLWENLGLASPFGSLEGLGSQPGKWGSALAFLALIALGFWASLRPGKEADGRKFIAVSGLAMAILGCFIAGGAIRHLLAYLPIPLLLAAYGLRVCLGSFAKPVGGAIVVTAFLGSVLAPIDVYRRLLPDEARYSQVAGWLREQLGNTPWAVIPYYYSNPLYQYGPLPEPFLPIGDSDFNEFLAGTTGTVGRVVLTTEDLAREHAELARLDPIARFARESSDLLIFRIGP